MFDLFKMELYKVRKRPLFLLLLMMPLLAFLYQLFFYESFDRKILIFTQYLNVDYTTAFLYHYNQLILLYSFLLLVLLCYTHVAEELKNGRCNALFTLPYPIFSVYNAKLFVLIAYLTAYTILLGLTTLLSAYLSPKVGSVNLNFLLYIWVVYVMLILFHYFVACLTKNFVLYMLLFIFLFGFVLLYKGDYKILIPYYYMHTCLNPIQGIEIPIKYICIVGSYIGLFYAFGFITFKKLIHGKSNKS